MRKIFKSKPKKKRNKIIISLFLFILVVMIVFRQLDKMPINIKDKILVEHLLKKTTNQNDKVFLNKIKSIFKKIYNEPTSYLLTTKSNLIKEKQLPTIKTEHQKNEDLPIIYIYNSHQTEEYAPSSFLEYTVNPTVMVANYILEETFNEKGYKTLVEESSIKEILNTNKWTYSYSYKASRILLEKRKQENTSLKYYIDVHRDSLKKNRTTIIINDKSYAKLLFIVGLENKSYQSNLDFTNQINNCLNQKYPNLSKGIYKKSGPGVNGIYNQDFSPYTILVEIGGYENTPTEVLNSSLAFSNCYLEVISANESQTST